MIVVQTDADARQVFLSNWRVYRLLRRDVPLYANLWQRSPFRELHDMLGRFWAKSPESGSPRQTAAKFFGWAAEAEAAGGLDDVAQGYRVLAREHSKRANDRLVMQKFVRQHPSLLPGLIPGMCLIWGVTTGDFFRSMRGF